MALRLKIALRCDHKRYPCCAEGSEGQDRCDAAKHRGERAGRANELFEYPDGESLLEDHRRGCQVPGDAGEGPTNDRGEPPVPRERSSDREPREGHKRESGHDDLQVTVRRRRSNHHHVGVQHDDDAHPRAMKVERSLEHDKLG